MGQFKAHLENEIDIAAAVDDLASHTGDIARDVALVLARLIEGAERTPSALSFYRHTPSAIADAKKGTKRKALVYTGAVTTRLRDKAEDAGLYTQNAIQLGDIRTDKAALMALLRTSGIGIPLKWEGGATNEPKQTSETTSERDNRILKRIQALQAQSVRNFRKQVAAEEHVSVERITQIARRARRRDAATAKAGQTKPAGLAAAWQRRRISR